jgi:integrase
MRRGEVAGLRWVDVDLDAGRVSPRRPRVVVNHEVLVSESKTAKGRRSIALDPATVAALRDHRRWQLEERLAVGPGWEDSGLVFTWPDSRPLHPERFSKWFEQHTPSRRPAQDQAARRPPQLRHRRPGGRDPGQDRQRAARARQHRHHHGHLQSRAARPGRAGGRHGGPARPRQTTPPEALR